MQFNIFCDVIDNYGDAGVCLRLCRDLCSKGHRTVLYANSIETVKKILTISDSENSSFSLLPWPLSEQNLSIQGIVVQAFSVRLPDFINRIISKNRLLVINLEYLTAEKFAEDCHTLPSYTDGFESFYFFPGFTDKTGGVVIEDSFLEAKNNLSSVKGNISLFCYENANTRDLITCLVNSDKNYSLYVFEGKPVQSLNNDLNTNLKAGDNLKIKNLNINVIPMTNQIKYDSILLKSEINLVRGEDSIVRAMLCARPFLWNIYPQEENAHKDKINALFDVMNRKCSQKDSVEKLRLLTLSYNNFSDYLSSFDLNSFMDSWKILSEEWSYNLIRNKSLTNNLLEFIKTKNVAEN
ncbi:MAG: elongation factor P maturation arginine rhamnosyltransferase EarP [Succinivibrio sp.]